MKKAILLLILFIGFMGASAQYPRATLWTSTMSNFAAQDAVGIEKDVVLFAGSSTFTMWTNLATDFPNSKVLNRAFGGSMMTDLIYFFGQVVAPYNPRQVVLYEGDNDLHESGKSADDFMEEVITMCRMINIYFPNTRILLVSVKPSPSRTATFPKYIAANSMMKNYADRFAHIEFADTWTPMLKQDGTPDASYFGSDMLHMNASGYVLWKGILEPFLLTKSGNGGNEPDPNAAGDIFVDFGSAAAGFPTTGNWNNIHDHQAANVQLINDEGVNTGITLKITDPFYNGFNTNGPTSVSGEAAIFPGTATSDNFFGHTMDWSTTPANPKGVIVFSGLQPGKYYSFSIFASRMAVSDNREAKYSFEGKDGLITSSLDASNNSTKVALNNNLQADANGEIKLTIEAGENNNNATRFYYIGAMRIRISDSPSAAPGLNIKEKMQVSYHDGTLRTSDYTGTILISDLSGRKLAELQSVFGQSSVRLEKGLYIICTKLGNSTLLVK
jgi:lysophospholipase L1-like esterase